MFGLGACDAVQAVRAVRPANAEARRGRIKGSGAELPGTGGPAAPAAPARGFRVSLGLALEDVSSHGIHPFCRTQHQPGILIKVCPEVICFRGSAVVDLGRGRATMVSDPENGATA